MKLILTFLCLTTIVFGGSFDSDDALFKFIYQKDRLELKQQQHRLRWLSMASLAGSFFMTSPNNQSGYLLAGLMGMTALHFDRQESVISNAYNDYKKKKDSDPDRLAAPYLVTIQSNYRSLRQIIAVGLVMSSMVSWNHETVDQKISRQLITLGIAGGMWQFEFPVERMIREHKESKKITLTIGHDWQHLTLGVAMSL